MSFDEKINNICFALQFGFFIIFLKAFLTNKKLSEILDVFQRKGFISKIDEIDIDIAYKL